MKQVILLIGIMAALFTVPVQARKQRDWQEWKLVQIEVVKSDRQFVAPIFGILIAGPLPSRTVLFIQRQGLCYGLLPKKSKPLNFTTNTTVNVAVHGLKAWVLDDSGKEVEFIIRRKHVMETDGPCHLKSGE